MELSSFTVYDIFAWCARCNSDKTALVFGEERLTHTDLKNRADFLAAGFASLGLEKGGRLAILSQNRTDYVAALGAAAALGAIAVPVNWRLSLEECRHVFTDTAPRVTLVDESQSARFEELVASGAPVGRPVGLGAGSPDFLRPEELASGGRPALASVASNDPFCILHTAAVEGKAKGAVLTHGNIVSGNLQAMAGLRLSGSPVHLCMLPLFHITGLNLTLAALHAGGTNVILEKFDAKAALSAIAEEGVTLMASFPPILATLTEEIVKGGAQIRTLRNVLGIDAPDTVKKFEEATGATFWCLYGQTETSGLVTFSPFREKPGSAGKEGQLAVVRLVDGEGREVAAGETGEITVRGPLVFAGYYNQPGATEKTRRDGWHHTGDLGSMDAEGYLWFKGRKPEKELIKPGGENVYPAEVEAACLTCPGVREVCVIGVPDKKWGEAVLAVCVLEKGASVSAEELIGHVGGRIARYKKPRRVVFADALPKKPDGSVDRARVKERHGRG
jgi:long-chain acyl-CoA synthetase